MSSKLSQAEIDALIAGMLSGEVDQATLDAALADSAAAEAAEPVPEAVASAPAVAEGALVEPVDLGPISQAELDAVLRAAGKGSLVAAAAPVAPSPGISLGPVMPPAPPLAAAPDSPMVAAPAQPPVQPVRPAFSLGGGPAANILLELELVLTAELVRTRMQLNQLLGLQPGSVLELNRLANEPVDVIINGHEMMKAKVVTMGENYGIQITETRLQQAG